MDIKGPMMLDPRDLASLFGSGDYASLFGSARAPGFGVPTLTVRRKPKPAAPNAWGAAGSPAPVPSPVAAPAAPQAPPEPEPQSQPFSLGGYLTDVMNNPMFAAGMSLLSGGQAMDALSAAKGASAANRQRGLEDKTRAEAEARKSSSKAAWSKIMSDPTSPILKGMPPELVQLAQGMAPEDGMQLLQAVALKRMGTDEAIRSARAASGMRMAERAAATKAAAGPAGDGYMPLTKPLQTQAQKTLVSVGDTVAKLEELMPLIKDEYGTVANDAASWWTWGKDVLGAEISPEERKSYQDYTEFKARAANLTNAAINALSGAAVSDAEAKRLQQELLALQSAIEGGDSPTMIRTKLGMMLGAAKETMARYQSYLRDGVPMTGPAAPAAAPSAAPSSPPDTGGDVVEIDGKFYSQTPDGEWIEH